MIPLVSFKGGGDIKCIAAHSALASLPVARVWPGPRGRGAVGCDGTPLLFARTARVNVRGCKYPRTCP
jgi:hypothetical protein